MCYIVIIWIYVLALRVLSSVHSCINKLFLLLICRVQEVSSCLIVCQKI